MGARKDKDIQILDHKAKKFKKLAQEYKKYNVGANKIAKMETRQARYEAWLAEVEAGPDY